MTGESSLSTAEASIAVVGFGSTGRRAVDRCRERRDDGVRPRSRSDASRSRSVFVASEDGGPSRPARGGATLAVVAPEETTDEVVDGIGKLPASARPVVVVTTSSAGGDGCDGASLDRLRRASDAVVVCPGEGEAALTEALDRLIRLLDTRSVVNLDVADLVTVLQRGDVGAFAHGRGDARTAVERAFADVPSNLRVGSAPAALVHVVGGRTTSVEAAGAVVDAVRERVDSEAHLIWGTTIVDKGDGDDDRLGLELVAGGVEHARDAGDPCPRCAASLVSYSLGERSAVVCDRCGFSGNAVRLR